jgi:class 3 adenylate cyclase
MVTSSTPFSPSAPRGPEGQAQFPHLPQGHSTHPQLRTSHEGSHAISSGALPQRLSSEGPLGGGEVPVVYKSWHPAVSVLFADISGYTALSTSVEPEQVRGRWGR